MALSLAEGSTFDTLEAAKDVIRQHALLIKRGFKLARPYPDKKRFNVCCAAMKTCPFSIRVQRRLKDRHDRSLGYHFKVIVFKAHDGCHHLHRKNVLTGHYLKHMISSDVARQRLGPASVIQAASRIGAPDVPYHVAHRIHKHISKLSSAQDDSHGPQ